MYDPETGKRPRIAVLTGAGMSAESGIATFRGAGGLWEGHRIEDVATPQAWKRNPELVLEFYNQRRRNVIAALPNEGHVRLAQWQSVMDIVVITQNVDDLHERAGSRKILHLHGEIRKSRSTVDPALIYDIGGAELNLGDTCEKGSQLRPHIVWFGEDVPLISDAAWLVNQCDALIVVGTSLQVYPAAGLVHERKTGVPAWIVDPYADDLAIPGGVSLIVAPATSGLMQVEAQLRLHFQL